MGKFQCLLFVLKRSNICYYIICITVHLTKKLTIIPAIKVDSNDEFEKTKMMKCIWKFVND